MDRMRSNFPLYIFLTMAPCALSSEVSAQDDTSAWGALLDSVTVHTYRYSSSVRHTSDGASLWDMGSMQQLPQVLGNADPVHYAQMLPGVQTNGEYRSGIYIQGCDNQHNVISVQGAPLYNVTHLLGFFSVFNAPHYASMSVARGATSSAAPNRLGGQLDVQHCLSLQDTVSGILSVGLISSQGTLRLPLSSSTSLTLSGRASYLNWLYGDWLRTDQQQLGFSFYDANATLLHRHGERHLFMVDLYSGSDHGDIAGGGYSVGLDARWGNYLGQVHWWYDGAGVSAHTMAYVTSYHNRVSLSLQGLDLPLSSGITDVGLRHETQFGLWSVGAEGILHLVQPQHSVADSVRSDVIRSTEVSAWGDYDYPLSRYWHLNGGLRFSGFLADGSRYSAIDPSVRLSYADGTWQWAVSYALRHQYLFQTGFSDAGLPTEYWLSADAQFSPQYAHEWTTGGSVYLFDRRYRLSADLFSRVLYHQLSYRGSVLDLANAASAAQPDWIGHGRGYSYGSSLMLHRCAGALTGWVSYTYTRARRTFSSGGCRRTSPASHERPHEVNAVAAYRLNRHWNLGATLVYASGTPFTAARSVYMLDRNIVLNYGEYNAARLSPYMRVDLSADYQWLDRRGAAHSVNLSVYNVGSRSNELFYYLRVRDDGTFVYRPVSFVLRVLPSLSYTYRF